MTKKAIKPVYVRSPEEEAEGLLDLGIPAVIAAFNLADNPERHWQFPPHVRFRAEELLTELHALFCDGEMQDMRPRGTEADTAFQRFISLATGIGVQH